MPDLDDPDYLDPRPCAGKNSNVCVAEGCHGESCMIRPVDLPEVYVVRDPEGRLFLPYPGSLGAGTEEAAEHMVRPNRHLGYQVIKCQLIPMEVAVPRD